MGLPPSCENEARKAAAGEGGAGKEAAEAAGGEGAPERGVFPQVFAASWRPARGGDRFLGASFRALRRAESYFGPSVKGSSGSGRG